MAKGTLCAGQRGFNPRTATKAAANDKQGRLTLRPVWLVEVATGPAPRLDGLAFRLSERTPIPCQPEGVSSRG